ncbi:hypothetical protein C8A05DRAFT_32086 [Staphylotrichum tortipilum]|uniref:Uncharacterized protein n=1 Tax=Staphylotrichum tortipilum TaxID=2831512 RepID=A0AAN6MQF7_9PEZI|nr:hypothetical protein C8A05DRAFT_32086 [Staphylotrichum longicolle]
MSLSPVETRKDGIPALRRDSASAYSSPHHSPPHADTPTNTSPRPSANPRFNPGLQLGLGSNSPPLTPVPGNNLLQPVYEEPITPSSTVVEFGDLGHGAVRSAVELVERIHRSYSQSRASLPESRSSSKTRGPQDGREGRDGVESRDQARSRSAAAPTAPRDRSHSTHARTPNEKHTTSDRGLADERINRFLQSMAAQSSESELVQENRSLYQRIAALQRTERELLAENQDLTRKLAAMKQHHERRARQWNEGVRRKEIEYETRTRELGEQLLDLVSKQPQKLPDILSNEAISTWFGDQEAAWNSWATTFGHQDPNRLTAGLHPLQLQELCGDVRGFVRMTDAGGLPLEMLSGGKEALHTLLNGMLANFICEGILASPMWVFMATSIGTLESPGVLPAKPLNGFPAVGLRMDMNSFNTVVPVRPGRSHVESPRSPQFPPPLITSILPPSNTTSASFLGLPMKPDMERLVHMITDAQDEDARISAHHWRAQMMRLLADGGFSLKDVASAGGNESRRTFVESRLNYARKLKERFLGGSARFLLQDQNARGIEKLERLLDDMIDDALRFSCRLWTRVAPLRLHGWKDLGSREIKAATPVVTLCHAQVEVEAHNARHESAKEKPGSPQENQTDHQIVMVVQPAVVTESINLPGVNVGAGGEGVALVWLKARVMVAGAMSTDDAGSPAGVGSQASLRPDTESTPAAFAGMTPLSGSPQPTEVLPASAFKAPDH